MVATVNLHPVSGFDNLCAIGAQLKKDNNEKRFNAARMNMVSRDDPTTTDYNISHATVST